MQKFKCDIFSNFQTLWSTLILVDLKVIEFTKKMLTTFIYEKA